MVHFQQLTVIQNQILKLLNEVTLMLTLNRPNTYKMFSKFGNVVVGILGSYIATMFIYTHTQKSPIMFSQINPITLSITLMVSKQYRFCHLKIGLVV